MSAAREGFLFSISPLVYAAGGKECVTELGFEQLGRFRCFAEFPVHLVEGRHYTHRDLPFIIPPPLFQDDEKHGEDWPDVDQGHMQFLTPG
jgi:hypothetical protein